MDLDTSSRSEQRKFGIVMAVAIVVVTLIRWLIRGELATWPLYLAGAFLILGVLLPFVLRPVLIVWMKFALAINWVMTRLLLSLVFYGMIVPTRLILKIRGSDPLKRTLEPEAATYWEEPEAQPEDLDAYRNQF